MRTQRAGRALARKAAARKKSGSTASVCQGSTNFTFWNTATRRRRESRFTREKTSEEHLSIELAKPFLFSADTWETPFEATLKGLFVKGPWEGYIGAILIFNIRIFSDERAQFEGQKNILSFGVGGTIGGSYHFTEHWALELGVDYGYVPTDPVVTHEFMFALGGVYHF
ncbi:MAG: hypothetical protein JRH14_18805 [Deltaproteobacteria bacterium]|nr:hypothetical protein [Deltaproteobacteria bacterium]